MTLNFPNSPSENDIYTYGSTTYRFKNGKWSLMRGQTEYILDNYTAISGDVIYADTSVQAFTITLPANPVSYSIVTVIDAESTHLLRNVTVDRNGSTIENEASNYTIVNAGLETTFVFFNNTWNIFTKSNNAYTPITIPAVVGPASAYELSTIELSIANYSGSYIYSITESGGSASRLFDKIEWTLPSVATNTVHTLQVDATLGINTSSYIFEITVLNIDVLSDSAIIITNYVNNSFNKGWSLV